MDKGSETGYIYAHQTGLRWNLPDPLFKFDIWHKSILRETYAPDIDGDQFPPAQHIKSIHNTPIKGLWHWFVTLFGIDIKEAIQEGKVTGIYNPGNPIHPYVLIIT